MNKNTEQKKQESNKEEPRISQITDSSKKRQAEVSESVNNEKTQVEEKEQKKTISLTEEEYNKLKQEAEAFKEYKEKVLRIQADFDNYRKRLEREKQEFVRYANQPLITDLLNVVDDLERTLELDEKNPENFPMFLRGVKMILAHLYELLKKYGVSPIEAEGAIFDPNYHEALLTIETDDYADNTVVEELQKGYMLNGRVIRTAKVKVSKKIEAKKSQDNEQKQEAKQ